MQNIGGSEMLKDIYGIFFRNDKVQK